jgi:hypothetical protein
MYSSVLNGGEHRKKSARPVRMKREKESGNDTVMQVYPTF